MTASSSSKYLYPVHCSSLCGRRAVLNLEVTSSISLPMCVTCWKILDPDGKYLFELIEEKEETEGN
jgi:hypothetical protein